MEPQKILSDYRPNPYKKNYSHFDTYLTSRRDHQLDAIFATNGKTHGQIIMPCGTGKTSVQILLHIQEMIRLANDFEYGVFAIASHRLSLNVQLLDQMVELAVHCGLKFNVLFVGSLRCDLSKYYVKYRKIGYTTQVSSHLSSVNHKDIKSFIQQSRDDNRNVIIASTYDSLNALKDIGVINLTTFDEAHNTIQNDFRKNILEVKSNILSEYYFTATRKTAGIDGGMNDKEFYGNILFDASPRAMLEAGEIVAPKLHRIIGKEMQTTNATNTDMLIKNTLEAFNEHRKYIKKVSAQPDKIGAKLLIGCDGIKEMNEIYSSLKALTSDVQVFAISSEGSSVNWEPCDKNKFFDKLNALSDSEDAIIFNVDMLTEGIDLPSITGVMPLRNLGLTKLIQLMGRSLRLHKLDRDSLYGGELTPCDYQNYIKPYGYLVVPQHLASIDRYEEMIKFAKIFYSEYGTTPEELIIEDRFIDYQPNRLNNMNEIDFGSHKDYELNHEESNLVEEINFQLLKENRGKQSSVERKNYIKGIFV